MRYRMEIAVPVRAAAPVTMDDDVDGDLAWPLVTDVLPRSV